jgi:HEAT repeat protein
MTEDIRPGVAELLQTKHRVQPAARAATRDRQDADQLIQIATGALHPEYRTKAMSVLGTQAGSTGVLRQALDDRAAPDIVRAAGATLLSRSGSDEAEDALIAALSDETSTAVRHKIVAGLARVGGNAAYRALGELSGQDGALAEHARFARTLIGYRIGAPTEPIVIAPDDLAPGDQDGDAVWANADDSLAADITGDIAADSYGIPLERAGVATVDCQGQRWALVLSIPEDPDRPAIAGVIALQSAVDSSYSTDSVVLWHPKQAGPADISIHRLDGRAEYAGEARPDGDTVEFRIDTVRGPGAVEKTVEGTLQAAGFTQLTVRSGVRLASRQPVAM